VRTKAGALFLRALALAAGLGIVMAAPAGPASSVTGQAAAASQAEGVPAFGHVFVIIGENATYSP